MEAQINSMSHETAGRLAEVFERTRASVKEYKITKIEVK